MSLTLTLIIVILTGLISYNAFNDRQMFSKLKFSPAIIKQTGEFHRFFTHGFVHVDFNHLFINLFVLYQFGGFIESFFNHIFGDLMGRMLFLLLYLGGIIVASIPSYFKHQDNGYYSAVGASGATSSIVFAYVLINPWSWFIFPPLPALLFAIGYLAYSSYMGKKGGDNIGHDAHFWGAVYGLVLTIILIVMLRPDLIDNIIQKFLAGPGAPPFM